MLKATGIVRKVDELGRIVLPKELRDAKSIAIKDPVEIFVDGEKIILQKYVPGCVLCGKIGRMHIYREKKVCDECVQEIRYIVQSQQEAAAASE